MKWKCDHKINLLFIEARSRIDEAIELSYINILSKSNSSDRTITNKLIEKYLERRGYVVNTLSRNRLLTKGFVCVAIHNNYIEIWHDIPNSKSSFVNDSLLTSLPIALRYYEKINN